LYGWRGACGIDDLVLLPSFNFEARIIRKTIVTTPYNSNFEISPSIVVRTPIFVVGYWPVGSFDE